jgi:hypothetical protein
VVSELKWYDPNANNPPLINALAEVRHRRVAIATWSADDTVTGVIEAGTAQTETETTGVPTMKIGPAVASRSVSSTKTATNIAATNKAADRKVIGPSTLRQSSDHEPPQTSADRLAA